MGFGAVRPLYSVSPTSGPVVGSASRLIGGVTLRWVSSVLGRVTAWGHYLLLALWSTLSAPYVVFSPLSGVSVTFFSPSWPLPPELSSLATVAGRSVDSVAFSVGAIGLLHYRSALLRVVFSTLASVCHAPSSEVASAAVSLHRSRSLGTHSSSVSYLSFRACSSGSWSCRSGGS